MCYSPNWKTIISSRNYKSVALSATIRKFSSSTLRDDDDTATAVTTDDYYQQYETLFSQHSGASSCASADKGSCNRSSLISKGIGNGHCKSSGDSQNEITSSSKSSLSHVDNTGRVKMVDVGQKSKTRRVAIATGRVILGDDAFRLVVESRVKKGNVLVTAQLAGIMAAKRTATLIPLCHHVPLTSVDLEFHMDQNRRAVEIRCTSIAVGATGVEMEALTGVTVAALTVYDMCKAVSHDIAITDIQLVSKTGGKSNYEKKL